MFTLIGDLRSNNIYYPLFSSDDVDPADRFCSTEDVVEMYDVDDIVRSDDGGKNA